VQPTPSSYNTPLPLQPALIPGLIAALKEEGAEEAMVVAGGVIPEIDHQMLIDAGVAAIFGPGTRVPLAARQVISQLTERLLEAQGEEVLVARKEAKKTRTAARTVD